YARGFDGGSEGLTSRNRARIEKGRRMVPFHVSTAWKCVVMDGNIIDSDIGTIDDGASARILTQRSGECLVCFVFRQVREFGCSFLNAFALTQRPWMTSMSFGELIGTRFRRRWEETSGTIEPCPPPCRSSSTVTPESTMRSRSPTCAAKTTS